MHIPSLSCLPSTLLVALFTAPLVTANTEIINFSATSSPHIDIPHLRPNLTSWPVYRSSSNEHQFLLDPAPLDTPLDHICEPHGTDPCPYELWTTLDLDDDGWTRYDRFTLRISWPASSPADFSMTLYTPTELADYFPHPSTSSRASSNLTTRRQYARIRVVHTGVRPPSQRDLASPPVPFILLLEPLYLGVLPASVALVLAFFALLIPVAWMVGRGIADRLGKVAQEVRRELRGMEVKKGVE
ncbi:hypothetical protein OF83DRAFT_573168 [Amylostereum chailletii]|nr:hypothetical protein OF83DRAFT_573168 [Amylostereum chailletii]